MENLKVIEGLDAAIRLLINTRKDLAGGSLAIWQLVSHAENHLDKQIKQLLTAVLLLIALAIPTHAEQRTITLASGTISTTSVGTFHSGAQIKQGNKAVMGPAFGFESWRRNYAVTGLFSQSSTTARLQTMKGGMILSWPLERYEISFMTQRRFMASRRFAPYVGAGGFVAALWGGVPKPGAPRSGADVLRGLAADGGVDMRLTHRVFLTAGMKADFGKASTYADQSYRSSSNIVYSPTIGIKVRLDSKRPTR